MMKPDPGILKEIQLIDPYLELEFYACRSPNGKDHSACPRLEWSRRRACNRWVLLRRVRRNGLLDRFGQKFLGKNWSGRTPDRIPVLIWEEPGTKRCGHVCERYYPVQCCVCNRLILEEQCPTCKAGPRDGFRPLNGLLPKMLRRWDTYRRFRDETDITNYTFEQMKLMISVEENMRKTLLAEAHEAYRRVLTTPGASDLLDMSPKEAEERIRDGRLRRRPGVHLRPEACRAWERDA